MKKILLFFIASLCMSSCYQVEPIHKLSQLEPALRKHIGVPFEVDTFYEKSSRSYNSIGFFFEEDVPEDTFEKLVSFLSEAYNSEPVWDISPKRKRVTLVPLSKEDGLYMVQTSECIVGKEKKREIVLAILDVNNELVPPSTSVSDSIPSTN